MNFFENSKYILYLIAFIACSSALGQFPDTARIRTYGGPDMEVGRDIQYTADGGFIIAGTTSSFGSGNTAVYLVKVDSNGIYQWSKEMGGIGIEWGFSVKQTFDKGYAVAGYTNSFGNGGYDMYLVKTDSGGNTLWEKTYGGSDWDFGYCVQQLPDSGFALCGETYSYGNGTADAFIVRTDKNGDTLWTRAIGGNSTDVAYSIVIYNDSTYCFTGETNSSGNGGVDILWGTINKQGTDFTTKTFGTTKNDKGYHIEKTLDDNVVIFGETDSVTTTATNANEFLLKVDSNGGLIWTHVIGSPTKDVGRAVKEKSNGDFITCATQGAPSGSGGAGLHIMMLNAGGWWLSGPSFGGSKDEEGYSLVITPKKEVALIGSTTSYGQGMQDVYFIKFKSDSIVNDYTLSIIQYKDTSLSPLSVPEYGQEKYALIYPNPFTESATLILENWNQLNAKIAYLKIYDLFGRELAGSEINSRQSEINRENLSSGMYFFTVSTSNKTICTGKFVIR